MMPKIGLTGPEIRQYYSGAYIKDPETGLVGKIRDIADESIGLLLFGAAASKVVRIADLTWEHVKIPRLGYRNVKKGKYNLLCHTDLRVGRITHKGLSSRTAYVYTPERVRVCASYLGIPCIEDWGFDGDVAVEIVNPKFSSVDEAVESIKKDVLTIGVATGFDTAVVASESADSFVLLYKKKEAAVSTEGKAWKLLCKELRDPLTRSVGKLLYVN